MNIVTFEQKIEYFAIMKYNIKLTDEEIEELISICTVDLKDAVCSLIEKYKKAEDKYFSNADSSSCAEISMIYNAKAEVYNLVGIDLQHLLNHPL